MRPSFHKLSTFLGRAVPLDTELPEESECPVCWRSYNNLDDVSDPEDPCIPLKQSQCNHIIGSSCYYNILDRGQSHCPFCFREVKTPIPRWLAFLFREFDDDDDRHGYPWPFHIILLPPGELGNFADLGINASGRRFRNGVRRQLCDLFESILDILSAIRLWWTYIHYVGDFVEYQLWYIIFSRFDTTLAMLSPTARIIPDITYALLVSSVYFKALPDPFTTNRFPWKLFLESFTIFAWSRIIPSWVLAIIMLADTLLFAILLGLLIGMGMWYGDLSRRRLRKRWPINCRTLMEQDQTHDGGIMSISMKSSWR